jgi:catalase (peroxidase I)
MLGPDVPNEDLIWQDPVPCRNIDLKIVTLKHLSKKIKQASGLSQL